MEHIGTVSGTQIVSPTGTFDTSLTVSGIPVALPGASVDSLNVQTGDVTITGVGTVESTTLGSAITISGSLRVRETDSNPLVDQVTEIVVTTGTLTNLGSGVVRIDTGGGGGGGSASEAGDIKLIAETFAL